MMDMDMGNPAAVPHILVFRDTSTYRNWIQEPAVQKRPRDEAPDADIGRAWS